MKRSIIIKNIADEPVKELIITRAAAMALKYKFFFLDALQDGSWRVNYSKSLFTELEALKSIELAQDNGKIKAVFHGTGVSLDIAKAVKVKDRFPKTAASNAMIHFEQRPGKHTLNGEPEWLMIYHESVIPDLSSIGQLVMHREN